MFPIEAFRDTIRKAICIFESHSIRYHLTGGVASVAYGEPRMTQDIDIVIDNTQAAAAGEGLIESFSHSEFLFDPAVIRNAISEHGMFQLLDKVESLKLDIYPRELIRGNSIDPSPPKYLKVLSCRLSRVRMQRLRN